MPERTRKIEINRRKYTATEHGVKRDGLRKPGYIIKCEAIARLVRFGESEKLFFFGYNQKDRLSFEMEGSWWHIDDPALFELMKNERKKVFAKRID